MRTTINANRPHAEELCPGDRVKVIDGTFAGMEGRVVERKEACELWERNGGEQPSARTPAGSIWVALVIFGRTAPVMLTRDQIQHARQNEERPAN